MKKRILKICTFSIILVFLLFLTSFIFTPRSNKVDNNVNGVGINGLIGEKQNSIDVIVIGDSITYSSIIPLEIYKETGIKTYVLGTSAQNLETSFKYLKTALEYQKPKVVILETNGFFRKIKNDNPIIAKSRLFSSIFNYHDRWKNMSIKDLFMKRDNTWTDTLKGYKYNVGVKAGKNYDYMNVEQKKVEIQLKNIEYLIKIIELCNEANSDFILLSCPSSVNWNKSKHDMIINLSKKYNNKYIDLNIDNLVNIDWEKDTRDAGDHLNHYGAIKTTLYLKEYLKDNYDFNKSDDMSWQNELIKYNSLINKN